MSRAHTPARKCKFEWKRKHSAEWTRMFDWKHKLGWTCKHPLEYAAERKRKLEWKRKHKPVSFEEALERQREKNAIKLFGPKTNRNVLVMKDGVRVEIKVDMTDPEQVQAIRDICNENKCFPLIAERDVVAEES